MTITCRNCDATFDCEEDAIQHLRDDHPWTIDECLEEYMSDAEHDAYITYMDEE